MKGFFSQDELDRLAENNSGVTRCSQCQLHRSCQSPRMEPSGMGERGILIVAEAPGRDEDLRGTQLVGQAGEVLRDALYELGVDLNRDCRKTNAVNCRPPQNRMPSPAEIDACRPMLWKEVEASRPKVIILLGMTAFLSFYGNRWKKKVGPLTRWRGFLIPDRKAKAWVMTTFHPSYILRNQDDAVLRKMWMDDLYSAINQVHTDLPTFRLEEDLIRVLMNEDDACDYLLDLNDRKPSFVTFDYETTGLKPYEPTQKIWSVSFCEQPHEAVSFLWTPRVAHYVKVVLSNGHIRKGASNMKFEDIWSRVKLNVAPRRWYWDTMLAAHVLDNRPGITSIKFQVMVRYGLVDYDSRIEPYLKHGGKDGANGLNQIHKLPVEEVLTYGGIDSLVEFRVSLDQMKEMGIR